MLTVMTGSQITWAGLMLTMMTGSQITWAGLMLTVMTGSQITVCWITINQTNFYLELYKYKFKNLIRTSKF
jgi:hypothetical protein